jgi:hypothetical protein
LSGRAVDGIGQSLLADRLPAFVADRTATEDPNGERRAEEGIAKQTGMAGGHRIRPAGWTERASVFVVSPPPIF